MPKTVVKTFKFPAETSRRLRSTARRRRLTEAEIVRTGLEREFAAEEIDMMAAVGKDFGCVESADPRPTREKLADFGR